MGRAIGALILAGMVGITCAFLVPKGPRVVPAVPSTAGEEASPNPVDEPWEPLPVLRPIFIEDEQPEPPCEGLSDVGSLACVLASPLDLDSFSDGTLRKADRAALRERLET